MFDKLVWSILSGNLGMERKRGNRESGGKIFKVDTGSRSKNTEVFDKEGVTEGQIERKGRK